MKDFFYYLNEANLIGKNQPMAFKKINSENGNPIWAFHIGDRLIASKPMINKIFHHLKHDFQIYVAILGKIIYIPDQYDQSYYTLINIRLFGKTLDNWHPLFESKVIAIENIN